MRRLHPPFVPCCLDNCYMTQAALVSVDIPITKSQRLQGGPDISSLAPHVQQEWDHERNAHLGPIKITPGSSKYAWWRQGLCQSSQPYRWRAKLHHRMHGSNCPYREGGHAACPCNDLAHNIRQLLPSLTWTQETCGQQSLSEQAARARCLGGVGSASTDGTIRSSAGLA